MKNVAVVGIGAMGKNHARVFHDMPEARLVAVADTNSALVQDLECKYFARGYTDHREMLDRERLDAVSVAVPVSLHHEIVRDALLAGCHVLVEKPITWNTEDARELIELADRLGCTLMVGHIERYNPSILELKRRLKEGELGRVFQIHARRVGPFPNRITDAGVVMDLATHDIDIMRYLLGKEIDRVFAATREQIVTEFEDLLNGILIFQDGTVGVLEINWLTPTKIRELYVTGERGMFAINYITQELILYENSKVTHDGWESLQLLQGVSEGKLIGYPIRKQEPLRLELEAFISALNGNPDQIVNGSDGLEAVSVAQAMMESAELGSIKVMGDR